MDRVEVTVDAEGMSHITVYDFKTNATPPSGAKVRDHIQLATYQRAVSEGAIRELPDATVADAGLVLLRSQASTAEPNSPKVMMQNTVTVRGSQTPQNYEEVVADAVTAIRTEQFAATPGDHCTWCQLQVVCPAKVMDSVGIADGDGVSDGDGDD